MRFHGGRCFFSFVVMLLVTASDYASCRDSNPTEVQALIGMKIPDDPNYVGPGWRPGSIADISDKWICLGGTRSGSLVADVCYRRDGLTTLMVTHHGARYRDYSTVVDALTTNSKNVRFPSDVRKKFHWAKDKQTNHRNRQSAYSYCYTEDDKETQSVYFGIAQPEIGMKDDCPHFTRRIERVWYMDRSNQRMVSRSIKGIYCWWNACLLEDGCRNEDQCNRP